LKDSHILPKWSYYRVVHPKRGDARNPVKLARAHATTTSKQLTEYLLCGICEQDFGRDENYMSTITLQPDDSFPAADAVVPLDRGKPTLRPADASKLDCDAISRFVLSVIWRASVCTYLPSVSLRQYEPGVRNYLLRKAPLLEACSWRSCGLQMRLGASTTA
jgi:hypothetical protein